MQRKGKRPEKLRADFRSRNKVPNPFVDPPPPPSPNPHLAISFYALLVGLAEVAYGIYLNYYSCGARFGVICVLGILTCLTVLTRFVLPWVRDLEFLRRIYYALAGLVAAIGVVTLYFINELNRQSICNYFICNSQVKCLSYVQYLNNIKGSQAINQACQNALQLNYSKADFTADMLLGIKAYYISLSSSNTDSNFNSNLTVYHTSDVRAFLIALGCATIFYSVLLVAHNIYLARSGTKFVFRIVQALVQKSFVNKGKTQQNGTAQEELSAEKRLELLFQIKPRANNSKEEIIDSEQNNNKGSINRNTHLDETQGIEPPNTEVRFFDALNGATKRAGKEAYNSQAQPYQDINDVSQEQLSPLYQDQQAPLRGTRARGSSREAQRKVRPAQAKQSPEKVSFAKKLLDSKRKPMQISDLGDATTSMQRAPQQRSQMQRGRNLEQDDDAQNSTLALRPGGIIDSQRKRKDEEAESIRLDSEEHNMSFGQGLDLNASGLKHDESQDIVGIP